MSNASSRGQVSSSAAEVYESFFVPSLFQQWTERMCDAARLAPGQRALDVACGTGVLARAAAARVGPTGHVAGIDINEGMLAVARSTSPAIEWQQCPAEQIAFEDGAFDAVLCQFGLMFFADRARAVREMARVLRRGGRLAVAVWDDLASSPGYAAMASLLQRLFGDTATRALQAPFALGAKRGLAQCFAAPDLVDVQIATHEGNAVFESIDAWVYTDIKGWTLAELIDDAQFAQLLEAARLEFRRFVEPDGRVVFRVPAHIASAVKR